MRPVARARAAAGSSAAALLPALLLSLAWACSPGGARPEHPLAGRWQGWILRDSARLATVIDIELQRRVPRGQVTYSDGLSLRTELRDIRLNGTRVSWLAAGAGGRAEFAGVIRGDTIRGPMRIGRLDGELRLTRAGAVPLTPWTAEPVRFAGANPNVSIGGTLLLPRSAGPHPAILLLSGSGEAPRETLWPFAEAFARNGIAALIYDKRGTGESSGDWETGPFLALAGDALAALRLLRDRTDIDGARIGLWGASEGGYLAPAVAVQDARVAFVILMSTAVVTPAEQDVLRIQDEMRAIGYGDRDIRDATALRRAAYEYLRTGRGRDALATRRQQLLDRRWMRSPGFGLGSIDGDPWWAWARSKMDYNPVPLLEQTRVPVLALYGERDLVVRAERNAALLRAALERAANTDVTIRIFAGADHSLTLPAGVRADTNGRWDFHRVGPGAVDTMVAWVRARTT